VCVQNICTCRDMRISPFYKYYGGHLGFLQNITCYICKNKWNPIFFLPLSYSEPESVAQSILTSKKSESCFYDKWAYTMLLINKHDGNKKIYCTCYFFLLELRTTVMSKTVIILVFIKLTTTCQNWKLIKITRMMIYDNHSYSMIMRQCSWNNRKTFLNLL